MPKNRSREILLELGLIHNRSVISIADHVRDRDNVGVLQDTSSGLIFLDQSDHIGTEYYTEIASGQYWNAASRKEALKKYATDDMRRFKEFGHLVEKKSVLDVGCGTGGFMDLAKDTATKMAGVEPQSAVRKDLAALGYHMYSLPQQVPSASCDVVTLFHVLEHFVEPIDTLVEIKRILKPGGLVVIEVPHARDALLALPAFREFTFWSEHLILHTKESLRKFLETAGFSKIELRGYQRYPVSNHLHWLVEQKPGGQSVFPELDKIHDEYVKILEESDKTDSLVAIAYA